MKRGHPGGIRPIYLSGKLNKLLEANLVIDWFNSNQNACPQTDLTWNELKTGSINETNEK